MREADQFTIQTQFFMIGPLLDIPENQQTIIVILREFKDNSGRCLFTHQELAKIVGSVNRQASSEHCEQFRSCGKQMLAFLQRRRKVDHQVVEAVGRVILTDPLIPSTDLTLRVNDDLNRMDLTAANINAALDQISGRLVRQSIRGKIESGQAHYSEQPLLEEMMSALTNIEDVDSAPESLIDKLMVSNIQARDDAIAASASKPASSVVSSLLTPGASLSSIPALWSITVFCMVLFGKGVSLATLGSWLGVHKTTILRRMIGLALALWTPLYEHIRLHVTATKIYVDEKWIKIRGTWHYWFVALDEATQIPIISFLSTRRNHWACRWVFVSLKMMGKSTVVVITDGLEAYVDALKQVFGTAKHVLCIFHYKQSITAWVKKHVSDPEKIKELKKRMKGILNTVDPRTAKRRLAALKDHAGDCDISAWIDSFKRKFSSLIPAIRRNLIPNTTNAVERFFRDFNRFYKTKTGFHSVESAKSELILFMVLYLFTVRWSTGKAPIESIWQEACQTPLYRLINDPLLMFIENPQINDYLKECKELAGG